MPKIHKRKQAKKPVKKRAKPASAAKQAHFSAVLRRWGGRVPVRPQHTAKKTKKRKKRIPLARRILASDYLWKAMVALIIIIMSYMIWLVPRQLHDVPATVQDAGQGLHSAHPIALPSLYAQTNCKQRLLTIVAHEDDDLLFINPDIQRTIDAGTCLRTVYVTAGDDGLTDSYWHDRALGARAAYAAMFHAPDKWHVVDAVVESHAVEAAYLEGHPSVALTFIHLPDGNPAGTGFSVHNEETLGRLRDGKINAVHTVDTKTSYTKDQLIHTLSAFMTLDKPTAIYTQAYSTVTTGDDHSDHQAVGYFTDQARMSYHRKHKFARYIGYPIGHMTANLTEEETARKTAIFSIYERYDPTICRDSVGYDCPNAGSYTNYLSRLYRQ